MAVLIKGPNFEFNHNYSIVNIIDKSATPDIVELPNAPYMFIAAKTPKGENGVNLTFSGSTGYADCIRNMGEGTFREHGQPYMTFLQHLENGGNGIINRICSPDDGMANMIVNVGVKLVEAQKVNLNGESIWIDGNGDEVTDDGGGLNTAVMVKHISTRVGLEYKSDLKNFESLEAYMGTASTTDVDGYEWFKFYGFAVLGQGKYGNNFSLRLSQVKNTGFVYPLYELEVLETTSTGTVIKEQFDITTVFDKVNGGIVQSTEEVLDLYSNFVQVAMDENVYDNIQTVIQEALDDNEEYGASMDAFEFIMPKLATTNKPWISLDTANEDYVDLTSATSFKHGSDTWTGNFTWNASYAADQIAEYKKAFDGTYTEDIYNTSIFPVDYICDANYPIDLKNSILAFVKKRFDIVYLMDLGKLKTLDQVKTVADGLDYDLYNVVVLPYHYKYRPSESSPSTTVTLPFIYSRMLLDHWTSQGYAVPMAGSDVATLALDTRYLLPRVTSPEGMSEMAERKLVYINYNRSSAYIDSQVTGQSTDSSLSELHNVFILNRIIKKLIEVLDVYKHKLDTAQEIQRLEDLGNEALAEFKSFCYELNYTLGFASEYEGRKGILTDDLQITFNRTIKKNRLNITILPKTYTS